jgi:para-nitrobenzyl esterase
MGLGLLALLFAFSHGAALVRQTDKGAVEGFTFGNAPVNAWLGIPYAAPPVGPLRLAAPIPHAWGVRGATEYGNSCIQKPSSGYAFQQGPASVFSEDCLFLNVYAPVNVPGPLPVMFFIHGGAFESGGGGQVTYNGTALASNGVVVVTINYRLGFLGFLALPQLNNASSGAFGFLDQQLALQWVQTNIAAFGGDPSRVTIFGESAGATSVTVHATTPSSWGLFSQAIFESSPAFFETSNFSVAYALGEGALQSNFVNCTTAADVVACLRDQTLAPASQFLLSDLQYLAIAFGPGAAVDMGPLQALLNKRLHPGALLGGNNADEGTLFVYEILAQPVPCVASSFFYSLVLQVLRLSVNVADVKQLYNCTAYNPSDARIALSAMVGDALLKCPSYDNIRARASIPGGPAYYYNFNHVPSWIFPNSSYLGAYHGAELPFVFDTAALQGANAAERVLADQMSRSWATFAKTSNPTIPDQPAWPQFDYLSQLSMQINTGTWSVAPEPDREVCSFWNRVYLHSMPIDPSYCGANYGECDPSAILPCCQAGFQCRRHAASACSAGACASAGPCANRTQFLCVAA